MGRSLELVHGAHSRPIEQPPSHTPPILPNGGSNPDRNGFHTNFDPATERPLDVIVEAVATIKNRRVDDLDPLHRSIDTEALSCLIADSSGDVEVRFVYEALVITMCSDGDMWLEREDNGPESPTR